jgi:hypothetical protein
MNSQATSVQWDEYKFVWDHQELEYINNEREKNN